MIQFQKMNPAKRADYLPYLDAAAHRGCGYSFANLYMWGRQESAVVEENLVAFSHFSGHTMYTFPAGPADPKPALDAIIQDARKRGIPCRITGMVEADKEVLESLYPGMFRFHCDRDSFDYVYDINDLAELKGRKFQQKRNHVNRFLQEYPDAMVKPLNEDTLPACRSMVDNWFSRRSQEDPQADLQLEQAAICRALRCFDALEMEGLVLFAGDRVAAVTMGSMLGSDTFDVHFEKADADIPGAYAAINRAFARYIRDKYPQIRYLNREDDMGIPGLRKAKLSYQPHHMVEKHWAHLAAEGYDD